MDVDGEETLDQAVKKLVRYALACEYQRISIKRAGISEKGQYISLRWLFGINRKQYLGNNLAPLNAYSRQRRHNYGPNLAWRWLNYRRGKRLH